MTKTVARGSWRHFKRSWMRADADGSDGTIIKGVGGRYIWAVFGSPLGTFAPAVAYGTESNLDDAISAADKGWVESLGPRGDL